MDLVIKFDEEQIDMIMENVTKVIEDAVRREVRRQLKEAKKEVF